MSARDIERSLLCKVLEHFLTGRVFPEVRSFRLRHEQHRHVLDALMNQGFLRQDQIWQSNETGYRLTLKGLRACNSEDARRIIQDCDDLIPALKDAYRQAPNRTWLVTELAQRTHKDTKAVETALMFLYELPIWSGLQQDQKTGLVSAIQLTETVLDAEPIGWPLDESLAEPLETKGAALRIQRLEIIGYRPFDKFTAKLGDLTVIIGANATGKSSLFDFLRFLAFAVSSPLPPEIDPRSVGKMLFHAGGPERIGCALIADLRQRKPLRYEVEILGPVGRPRVVRERLATTEPLAPAEQEPFVFLDFQSGTGVVRDQVERRLKRPEWTVQPNELALRRALDPTLVTLSKFQSFISSWRFYSGFDVSASAAIRRPVPTEPEPTLSEDGANLSAVLFSLMTEYPQAWQELETHVQTAIPGLQSLSVKAQGGPGTVIGLWREAGVKDELTLADLSDGTLRLLCWATLCLSSSMPPVICIDEPELGLHPRVLPIVAGLLRFASARSQIVVATHSPYFLSQFSLDEIAVMRKEKGRAVFVRPSTNAALRREIEEIGGEGLAKLHISDELETRA